MNNPIQPPQTKAEHDKFEQDFADAVRSHSVHRLLDLFRPTGEYSICRKDGQPLCLGDIMTIGDIFEEAERLNPVLPADPKPKMAERGWMGTRGQFDAGD